MLLYRSHCRPLTSDPSDTVRFSSAVSINICTCPLHLPYLPFRLLSLVLLKVSTY